MWDIDWFLNWKSLFDFRFFFLIFSFKLIYEVKLFVFLLWDGKEIFWLVFLLFCEVVSEEFDFFMLKYVILVVNGDIFIGLGLECMFCLSIVLLEFVIKIDGEFLLVGFLVCILMFLLLVIYL